MIHDSRAQDISSLIDDGRPFRIVAVYDSEEASLETNRAAAIVLQELGHDVPFDESSWKLDALSSWSVCDLAASEAACADMIVLALGSDSPLDVLQHWLESWDKKRTLEGGLLALIPMDKSRKTIALEDYLYETAVTAQMDFLCRKGPRY